MHMFYSAQSFQMSAEQIANAVLYYFNGQCLGFRKPSECLIEVSRLTANRIREIVCDVICRRGLNFLRADMSKIRFNEELMLGFADIQAKVNEHFQ